MGYGADDEHWGESLAADDERSRRYEAGELTDFEAMLDYNEMDYYEFERESLSEQANIKWRWRTFGRKEYKQRFK